MAEEAYTLKKKEDTDELHLFKGEMTEKGCTRVSKSICEKMHRDEIEGDNLFSCVTENVARKKCAEIGRSVCGICVSSLYTTYEE